ncbi:MAG TPA: hypothetical protein VFQ59_03485 [Candidatus Paceibacterota bacterium]|nr:hypothetical protein [Candidatus Paceibacterota bacterium]
MKIPSRFPQFKGETTIIIVSGQQNAVFYKVLNGIIERLDIFKIPRRHYSDNEGRFKVRGRGKTIRAGGTLEPKDDAVVNDFIREFKNRIKNIPEFARLYLLAPATTKNKIKSILPKSWQNKIQDVIEGNYYYRHPLFIVELLSKGGI